MNTPTFPRSRLGAAWAICLIPQAALAQWTQLGGDAAHTALAPSAPIALSSQLWLRGQNPPGTSIAFVGPSAPAILGDRIFAYARRFSGSVHVNNKIVAIDRATGEVLFETTVDKSVLDSWSSPSADAIGQTVYIGSGNKLFCINAATGAIPWQRPLARSVVNASPLIVEDPARGRVLITDYDGFGAAASLYCINTSPFSAAINAYQPGDIVWQEPIGGSSGNTPAYADGVIYVCSVRGASDSFGRVRAFDLHGAAGARLLWEWVMPFSEGFFGGLTVQQGFVYAATYDLNGSGDNSTLIKLRAVDGQLQWTTPCERSASIPLIDGNRIYLSAGIQGFGSVPKIQAFQDLGTSAMKVWDTYADTAGGLIVGGWNHHPVLGDGILLAGTIPTGGDFFGACTDLYVLDLARAPGQTGFVLAHRAGLGSSPAIAEGRVYSIGQTGLAAIAARGDFHPDGRLDGRDVQEFVTALLSSPQAPADIALGDFNQNSILDTADIPGFLQFIMNP